jgi:hypothetical protein
MADEQTCEVGSTLAPLTYLWLIKEEYEFNVVQIVMS